MSMGDTTAFYGRNDWAEVDYEVTVTNGAERITLGLRPTDVNTGEFASMTPPEARRYARDILRRVDRVEAAQRKARLKT